MTRNARFAGIAHAHMHTQETPPVTQPPSCPPTHLVKVGGDVEDCGLEGRGGRRHCAHCLPGPPAGVAQHQQRGVVHCRAGAVAGAAGSLQWARGAGPGCLQPRDPQMLLGVSDRPTSLLPTEAAAQTGEAGTQGREGSGSAAAEGGSGGAPVMGVTPRNSAAASTKTAVCHALSLAMLLMALQKRGRPGWRAEGSKSPDTQEGGQYRGLSAGACSDGVQGVLAAGEGPVVRVAAVLAGGGLGQAAAARWMSHRER